MYYISQTSLEEQTKNVHVCILLCISYKYIMKGTLIDWMGLESLTVAMSMLERLRTWQLPSLQRWIYLSSCSLGLKA